MSPALLEFASGAVVSIAMSFDVPKHNHAPIEIYGTEGSILVPDPNQFGGEVAARPSRAATGRPVRMTHGNVDGEFRSIGVADLAASITSDRPHRASGALALHALEAMEAFQTSADEGRRVKLETPRRAAGDDDGGHADRARWTEVRSREHAQCIDRLGRLAGHDPEECAAIVRGWLQGGRLPVRRGRAEAFCRARHQGSVVDRADLHHVQDARSGANNLCAAVEKRRRHGRPPRRHGRCLPQFGRLPVHVRRPVGGPPGQHHRLQCRRRPSRTTRSCRA